MKQYIDKSALAAEINRLIKKNELYLDENASDEVRFQKTSAYSVLCDLRHFLDTLEMKEIDDELQGLEKEVAEDYVGLINKKRVPIELKGELKAKFKNEFKTLWQTVNGIDFANVAKPIIERICLNFATWGFYNLSKIGDIKGNKEIDSIGIAQKGE